MMDDTIFASGLDPDVNMFDLGSDPRRLRLIMTDEELAAVSLGANGWQMFWHVTLPNIKWGLIYGVVLCTARAMGEFGAVSVVSGHIRGVTNTLPLHVEILYNEYNFVAAFAAASLLAMLALVTLTAKALVEWWSPEVGHLEARGGRAAEIRTVAT